NPFEDVAADQYYYKAVLWAVEKGITTGTSPTTFRPDRTCTRGQIVTFLWRSKDKPEPEKTENPFVDVPADQYYYKAELWAVEKGVTTGTSATKFSPDSTCTRAQIVTFLYRSIVK
ncbi:MAG: S-layer homology domain-containing protein, partial [Oscillospiraceae bacterium]|nr:S-layer homology domain-containing protein [Oscillospiraceae bacterium]